jgi:hypothetical protein
MIGTPHKQVTLCDLCTTAGCSVEERLGFVQSNYLSDNPYIREFFIQNFGVLWLFQSQICFSQLVGCTAFAIYFYVLLGKCL